MEAKDIDGHRPSKWIPVTDLRQLAALGKLMEELGELQSIVARTIIQGGINECDPETGEENGASLQDELADVRGMIILVSELYGFDKEYIHARADKKLRMKRDWLEMLT